MPEIEFGKSYRLIGGEKVKVVGTDDISGIVTVSDQDGNRRQLAFTAFVGSIPVADTRTYTPCRNPVLDFHLDDSDDLRPRPTPAAPVEQSAKVVDDDDVLEAIDRLDPIYADGYDMAVSPEPAAAALPADDGIELDLPPWDEHRDLELELPDWQDELPELGAADDHRGDDTAAAPGDEQTIRDASPGDDLDGDLDDTLPPERPPEAPHPAAALAAAPAEPTTRELPFEPPDEESPMMEDARTDGGLSPLLVGLLFGTLSLVGGGAWWSVQERLVQQQETIELLATRLSETRLAAPVRPASGSATGAVQPIDRTLEQRIETLAGVVEDLGKRMAAEQQGLAELQQALEKVEKGLAERLAKVENGTAATRRTTRAAPTARPAPVSRPATAPPAAATAVAIPEPPAAERPSGFVVILASFPTRRQAEEETARLKADGINATMRETQIDDKPWYRLQVEGFAERALATAYVRRLSQKHGITNAWVASF